MDTFEPLVQLFWVSFGDPPHSAVRKPTSSDTRTANHFTPLTTLASPLPGSMADKKSDTVDLH